jgi:hypothetical protein
MDSLKYLATTEVKKELSFYVLVSGFNDHILKRSSSPLFSCSMREHVIQFCVSMHCVCAFIDANYIYDRLDSYAKHDTYVVAFPPHTFLLLNSLPSTLEPLRVCEQLGWELIVTLNVNGFVYSLETFIILRLSLCNRVTVLRNSHVLSI